MQTSKRGGLDPSTYGSWRNQCYRGYNIYCKKKLKELAKITLVHQIFCFVQVRLNRMAWQGWTMNYVLDTDKTFISTRQIWGFVEFLANQRALYKINGTTDSDGAYFASHSHSRSELPTCLTALMVVNIYTMERENPVTGKIHVTKTATNAFLNLHKLGDLQLIGLGTYINVTNCEPANFGTPQFIDSKTKLSYVLCCNAQVGNLHFISTLLSQNKYFGHWANSNL